MTYRICYWICILLFQKGQLLDSQDIIKIIKHYLYLIKNQKKEIDVGDYKIVSSDINEGLGKGGTTPEEDPKPTPGNGGTNDLVDDLKNTDVDKPEFGSNGDNPDSKKDKSDNPQTGDLTNIWLYAFLLAGSLLVLGFKFRRRTI